MEELNTTLSVDTFDQDGCDPLTVVDMGEMVALSQVADDERLHNVVIGLDQAKRLYEFLGQVLA